MKNVGFFSPIGNFLMNFSFDSQRCFALLSVFIILSTTLTCRLCCFYGMYADTGFFFFIVDIELGVFCWAESLNGSDETRENQVGSATTAYKCWNQETSELLTTLRNNTPMCKNRRSRSEISVFSLFFFSLSKQSLVETLRSNLCLYALFSSSAASAPDSNGLFELFGMLSSVPADRPPL